jgi:hypothetical protein
MRAVCLAVLLALFLAGCHAGNVNSGDGWRLLYAADAPADRYSSPRIELLLGQLGPWLTVDLSKAQDFYVLPTPVPSGDAGGS